MSGSACARRSSPTRVAAGDRDVVIMGAGDVIRQCLDGGLLDELIIHLAPVVLSGGTPRFAGDARHELVRGEVRVSATPTHLTYTVRD